MQDVKAKDTEHKRNYDARLGGDRPKKESMDVKEVAEFIHSFYDRNTGTFPKGPEGVCTMVGKKFGEQAEAVARKLVERMAPRQTTKQNPELAELARIKELSGVHSNQKVTQESTSSYMWNEVGDEQDQRHLNRIAQDIVKMYGRAGEVEASPEEILSMLDKIVRHFVPKVGEMRNVAPVSQAFFDKFPLRKDEPEYDDDGEEIQPEYDVRDDFHRDIWNLVKIAADAEKGNTSMYGYKVQPNLNKESTNPELESIKRLSGISQGLGF